VSPLVSAAACNVPVMTCAGDALLSQLKTRNLLHISLSRRKVVVAAPLAMDSDPSSPRIGVPPASGSGGKCVCGWGGALLVNQYR
jgi:hypothetical protein